MTPFQLLVLNWCNQYGGTTCRDGRTGPLSEGKHSKGKFTGIPSKTSKLPPVVSSKIGRLKAAANILKLNASNEHGAAMPKDKHGNLWPTMAQPAFPVVGVSEADRKAGFTGSTGGSGEGRVHITTKNGKAEVIPYSTLMKGDDYLPVIFATPEHKAMEKAAVDAINNLPASEKQGQLYAPDMVKTKNGYKAVEANPANEIGSSGYLTWDPFLVDAYVSHLTGRTPSHVRFIRGLITKKQKVSNSTFQELGSWLENSGEGSGKIYVRDNNVMFSGMGDYNTIVHNLKLIDGVDEVFIGKEPDAWEGWQQVYPTINFDPENGDDLDEEENEEEDE